MKRNVILLPKFLIIFLVIFIFACKCSYSQYGETFINDTFQKKYEEVLPKFKARLDSIIKIAITYKGYTLKHIINTKVLVQSLQCKETFNKICLEKIYKDIDSLSINDSLFTKSLTDLLSADDFDNDFAELYLISEFMNSFSIEVASAASICYWEKLYYLDNISYLFTKFVSSKDYETKKKIIINNISQSQKK